MIVLALIIVIILILIINLHEKSSYNNFEIVQINIEKTDNNYANVRNVQELEKALLNNQIQLIEISEDIDLGYNVIKNQLSTNQIFKKHNIPLTHPKLIETGVSKLNIENKENLILYSNNGSKILHCNIKINNSKNIKIENLLFEELWEWDEETKAEYDRNDWDYITIENSEKICIRNCEFSKSYDGITDIKNSKDITIEYCKVNEIDINDYFYNEQFIYLEENKNNYPMYQFLREYLSYEEIKELCSYQFKVYTIGEVERVNKKCTNIVIHDSLYLNVKTRLPLIRNGTAHIYNIYADSTKISDLMKKLVNEGTFYIIKEKYSKFISLNAYGIISVEKAYVLSENTVYNGAKYPYTNYRKNLDESSGRIKIKNDNKITRNLRKILEENTGIKENE